eukprot:jgi/Mesvir1/6662/Mv06398-RA.1
MLKTSSGIFNKNVTATWDFRTATTSSNSNNNTSTATRELASLKAVGLSAVNLIFSTTSNATTRDFSLSESEWSAMSCQFDSGVSGNNVTVKLTFNDTLALKYPSTDTTIKYALGTREKTTQTVTKQNNANILNVNLGDVAGWAFGNAETNFITTSGTITVTIPGSTFLVGTSTNNEITEAVRFTLAFNPAGSQTPVALGDLTDLNVANCVWQFGSNAGVRALTDARVPSVVTGVADKFGTTASVLYIAFNAGKLATVASTTVVTWSAGHGTSGTLDLKNFETTLVTKDVDDCGSTSALFSHL